MLINPYTLDKSAQHDQRYFAMFNNSVVVIGKPNLEGGNSQDALNYYQYIFDVKIKELPESLDLVCEANNQAVILAMKQGLERLQEITQLIDKNIAASGVTLEASRVILEKIKQQCETGACYFASGFKNKDNGHYASMKVRHIHANRYAFSLINLGAGAEYHLVTGFNGDRTKRCYQSNEFEMDFTTQSTVEFILHVLQLRHDKSLQNSVNIKQFSQDDLYGLLLIYGQQIVIQDKIDLKSSTGQRAGCCTMTNLHAAMHDIMVNHDCDSKQYKRYHFSMKLKSIMVAFNGFLDQQVSHDVLLWSLKELSVRINKHDKLLTFEEMSFCTELVFSLTEKANEVEKGRAKNEVLKFPPFSGMIKGYDYTILDRGLIQAKKESLVSEATNDCDYGPFVPERVIKILELFYEKITSAFQVDEGVVIELHELLLKMQPCFAKEADSFWDKFPIKELAYLFEILFRYSLGVNFSEAVTGRTLIRFIVSLQLYDIFAQFAPRYQNANGDGFKLGDEYTFGLDDDCFDQQNFNDPYIYKHAQIIQHRFKERAQGKKRIFTNCVRSQKNDFDATPFYLMHVLMSEQDRNDVKNLKKDFQQSAIKELDDFMSFSVFIEDFENKWPGPEKRMQIDSIAKVAFPLIIVRNIYARSRKTTKYIIDNENFVAYFSLEKQVRALIKHSQRFPLLKPMENKFEVSTFLENTIYFKDLLVQQSSIKLIQTQTSGSLNPNSIVWEPSLYQIAIFQLIDEELKHLECAPHLQVIRALNWCCANFESLKYPEIRKCITGLIFEYSLLEHAIADQFESLLFQFSRLIAISSKSLEVAADESHELLIWIIETMSAITQYIELLAPIYLIDLQTKTIPDLIPLLKQRLSVATKESHCQQLAAVMISCFHNRPIESLDKACEFLVWRILANLGDYAASRERTWAMHSKKIHQILLADKTQTIPVLNQMLNNYRVFCNEKKWRFEQNDLISEDVRINILKGMLLTENSGIPKKCTEQVFANNAKLFAELGLKSDAVDIYYLSGEHRDLFTLDRKWEFQCESLTSYYGPFKIEFVLRTVVIENVELKLLLNPNVNIPQFDFGEDSEEQSYFYWICREHPFLLFANRKEDPSIFYHYNAMLVNPIRLMNQGFADAKQFDEIKQWGKMDSRCALIKDKDNKIWFIDSIPNRTRALLVDQSKPEVKAVIDALKFSTISDLEKVDEIDTNNAAHYALLNTLIHEQIEQQRGLPPRAYTLIKEYKLNERNNLCDTNRIYLNLFITPNALEKNWMNFFMNYLGVTSVRCIAEFDPSSKLHSIISIEHLQLKLSFNMTSDRLLESREFPGYFLTPFIFRENPGFANAILLVNNDDKKIVIVPSYRIRSGESPDRMQVLFDKRNLIDKKNPYYVFSSGKNGMSVISENQRVEAGLYLSLIYAYSDNFLYAINALNDSHALNELSSTSMNIIYMAMNNRTNSPMYAAYCLKLHCYLKEHLSYWSKTFNLDKPYNIDNSWYVYIKSQMSFYYQTVSQRKQHISILPAYLCLTEEELNWLSYAQSSLLAREFAKDSKMKLNKTQLACLDDEIKFERLSDFLNSSQDDQAKTIQGSFNDHFDCDNEFYPTELRLPFKILSGLTPYIAKYFDLLIKLALSSQQEDQLQLKKSIFIILRSKTLPHLDVNLLCTALLFTAMHRDHAKLVGFEVDKNPKETIKKLFAAISAICAQEKLPSNHEIIFLKLDSAEVAPTHKHAKVCDYYKHPFRYGRNISNLFAVYEHPFNDVVNDYFIEKSTPIVQPDFPLAVLEMQLTNPIEKKLFNGYMAGHCENLKKNSLTYALNDKHSLNELAVHLNSKRLDIDNKIKTIESELLSCNEIVIANPNLRSGTDEIRERLPLNIGLARNTGLKKKINFYDVLHAFQNYQTDFLAIQNPYPLATHTREAYTKLCDLLLLKSAKGILKSALDYLNNHNLSTEAKINSIASILNWKRLYNLNELTHHTLLYFEFISKKQLRPEQVQILLACFEPVASANTLEWHAWIQFPAGGGKTAVIIPNLIKAIDNHLKLPVLFNTNELYHISKVQMPPVLKKLFSIGMQVIEFGIDHKWNIDELSSLFNTLLRWKRNSVCVLMTPETWHSIFLTLKSAFFNDNADLAYQAMYVLDIFREHSIKIEDEFHLTSSSLQLYIKTVGKPVPIPRFLFDILIDAYGHLLGTGKIASMSELRFGRKYPANKSMLLALQKELASELIKNAIFATLPANQILDYWLQAEKTRPDWLVHLANVNISEQVESIVYVRAILHTHLPRLLLLKKDKDYGKSTHAGDLTVAPKHECKEVTSHFADYTMVAALTIQLYHQNGLHPSQAAQVLDLLRKEHLLELAQFRGVMQTPAETLVISCVKEVESLSELTMSLKERICNSQQFCNHKQVINRYLLSFALKQIRFHTERLTSTAADFKFGFNKSYSFSATPGLEAMYPASPPHDYFVLDPSFESLVIYQLLSPANRHFSFIHTSDNNESLLSPAEFFQKLDPALLKTLTTLIDRGALLTDFTTEQVIDAYLKCNPQHVSSQTAAFFAEEKLHLHTNDKNVKPFTIKGASLTNELAKQGINPENFVLFLFLDLSKTTGTDMQRPHQDKAGLTVGQNQTMTETIQAAMRERKLLESDAQTITWLMFKSLYQHLSGCDVFDPCKLFTWFIKNEACDFESKIINRAYQGIYHKLSLVAWGESVFKDKSNDKTWFDFTYKDALRETVTFSPWAIYELPSTRENTRKVLENYVEELKTKRFKFAERDVIIHDKVNKEIQTIIDQTVELIPEMESPPKYCLDLEVQQETQVEIDVQEDQFLQQTQQSQHMKLNDDFTFAVESYRLPQDDLAQISQYQHFTLPDCKAIKIPKILFSKAHFSVTNQGDSQSANEISELKPIRMFVVQMNAEKFCQYLICTAAGGEFYYHRILQVAKDAKSHAYLLVSSEGQILANSKNITWEEATQIQATKSFQEIVTFIQLLNGQISNMPILAEMIKTYQWTKQDFANISNAIARIHVSNQPLLLETNPVLESLCGWTKTANSTNSSFFFQTHTKSTAVQAQQVLIPDKRNKNFDVKLGPSLPTQPIQF